MTTFKLAEQIVTDTITKLKAGLPARITAINAEFSDAITNAAPSNSAYFNGRVKDFPAAPSIFVMEGPTNYIEEGTLGLISETEVIVYLFESDATGPRLATRLQRLQRAITECLYLDSPAKALANSFYLAPTRSMPGDVFEPDKEHQWRSFSIIVFTARQLES